MVLHAARSAGGTPCALRFLRLRPFAGRPFGAAVAVPAPLRLQLQSRSGGAAGPAHTSAAPPGVQRQRGQLGVRPGARVQPGTTPLPRQRFQEFRRAFMRDLAVCKKLPLQTLLQRQKAWRAGQEARSASWPATATAAQALRPRFAAGSRRSGGRQRATASARWRSRSSRTCSSTRTR